MNGNNDTDLLAPTVQQLSGSSSSSSSPGSSRAEALIAAVCVRLLRCSLRTVRLCLHGFRCAGSPGIVTNIRCLNREVGGRDLPYQSIHPSIHPSVRLSLFCTAAFLPAEVAIAPPRCCCHVIERRRVPIRERNNQLDGNTRLSEDTIQSCAGASWGRGQCVTLLAATAEGTGAAFCHLGAEQHQCTPRFLPLSLVVSSNPRPHPGTIDEGECERELKDESLVDGDGQVPPEATTQSGCSIPSARVGGGGQIMPHHMAYFSFHSAAQANNSVRKRFGFVV
ncbi:hypothetical protein D4764_03G0007880 [Takifugu flavidus]|uniref:Uncharacterized protein n=1 Tax=Takifugu flavidus TaxID=433684 RepID=A0A5C6ND03_9TELE|nr:hypothetical protein D4764_03G0007880 [Takifugu flavidus]